jgi:hypothetical protein
MNPTHKWMPVVALLFAVTRRRKGQHAIRMAWLPWTGDSRGENGAANRPVTQVTESRTDKCLFSL